ncbi:MAG: class I tRNA ligase family protein, partial [Sedimentisphaerales bacterium]|nr:class I tRNA ligase family protein [Sedimentisphaerales bacterium]
GNGIDPLVVIDSHGADAMRFALTSMTTLTQDVRMPVEPIKLPDGRVVNTSPKFDVGRNFCNKLWNASRFALSNLQNTPTGPFDADQLRLEDRWILSRLARTIEVVTGQLDEFKFSEPINVLYRFFWNDLCDWYLELIKPRMRDDEQKGAAQRVLAFVMDACLRLFHPFLPFITEGIYQQLNELCPQRDLDGFAELGGSDELVLAGWPKAMPDLIDSESERQLLLVQTIIRLIRDIRTQHQVPPRKTLEAAVRAANGPSEILLAQQHLICRMANISSLSAGPDCVKPAQAATAVSEELEVYVGGVIDAEAEQKRLLKQKEELAGAMARTENKLNNENFVTRAKPEVVQRERDRLKQLKEQVATVQRNLDEHAG